MVLNQSRYAPPGFNCERKLIFENVNVIKFFAFCRYKWSLNKIGSRKIFTMYLDEFNSSYHLMVTQCFIN